MACLVNFLKKHEFRSSFHLMQLLFVYVEIDNEEVGKPVADYFGITGDGPHVSFFTS